jgi:hypothetical protein
VSGPQITGLVALVEDEYTLVIDRGADAGVAPGPRLTLGPSWKVAARVFAERAGSGDSGDTLWGRVAVRPKIGPQQ